MNRRGLNSARMAVAVFFTLLMIIGGIVNGSNGIVEAKTTVRKSPAQISQQYSSGTGWLLVCDVQKHILTVFRNTAKPGRKWKPAKYRAFYCTTGALVTKKGNKQTCTPLGYTKLLRKQKVHTFSTSKSWYNYWTQKGFAIHSTLYRKSDSKPVKEIDGRMRLNVSSSCIRVKLDNAKWIYQTMPLYTPLIVY